MHLYGPHTFLWKKVDNFKWLFLRSLLRTAQMMIFSLVAMIGLEKCCLTSACLQWLCHSGERIVARGPLVFFVKDFSGTTAPRILKFGTNIWYDLLYCVRQNQHPHAYRFLYLSIFLFRQRFLRNYCT